MIHQSGTFFRLRLVIFPEISGPKHPFSSWLYFKPGGWVQAGSLALKGEGNSAVWPTFRAMNRYFQYGLVNKRFVTLCIKIIRRYACLGFCINPAQIIAAEIIAIEMLKVCGNKFSRPWKVQVKHEMLELTLQDHGGKIPQDLGGHTEVWILKTFSLLLATQGECCITFVEC